MAISPTTQDVMEALQYGIVGAQGSTTKNSIVTSHWRKSAGTAPTNPIAFEVAYQTAIGAVIALALNARYTQTFTTARVINDVTNMAIQTTETDAGAVTGDSMPASSSAYILLRSQYRGKNFRGNKKLFPMSESDTTAGTADLFNAAALTRLGAIAAAILAGFTDSTGAVWKPFILSKKLSTLKKNPTVIYGADVTAVLINKRVGKMKKRAVASVY